MGRRVLLVEDDAPIREAVEEVLADEGWTVVGVAGITDARAALERQSFDALLLDLMLEDGAGEDLLRDLQTKKSELPTVIISASTRAAATAKAFGVELLRKPFEIDALLDHMNRMATKK